MGTTQLSDDQIVELVKRLPDERKRQILIDLTADRDHWWAAESRQGEHDMRRLAKERGLDWNAMSESEREAFVDDVLHEA